MTAPDRRDDSVLKFPESENLFIQNTSWSDFPSASKDFTPQKPKRMVPHRRNSMIETYSSHSDFGHTAPTEVYGFTSNHKGLGHNKDTSHYDFGHTSHSDFGHTSHSDFGHTSNSDFGHNPFSPSTHTAQESAFGSNSVHTAFGSNSVHTAFGNAADEDVFGSDPMDSDPWIDFSDDFECSGRSKDDGSDSSGEEEELFSVVFQNKEAHTQNGETRATKEGTMPLRDHNEQEKNRGRPSRGRQGRRASMTMRIPSNEDVGQKRRNRSRSKPSFVAGRQTRSLSATRRSVSTSEVDDERKTSSNHSRKSVVPSPSVKKDKKKDKSKKSKGDKSKKSSKAAKDKSLKKSKDKSSKDKSSKGSKDESQKATKLSRSKSPRRSRSKSPSPIKATKSSRSKSPRSASDKMPKAPRTSRSESPKPARSKSPNALKDKLPKLPKSSRSKSPKPSRSKSPTSPRSKSPKSTRGSRRSQSPMAARSKSPKSTTRGTRRSKSPKTSRSKSPRSPRSKSPKPTRGSRRSQSPMVARSKSPKSPRRSKSPKTGRERSLKSSNSSRDGSRKAIAADGKQIEIEAPIDTSSEPPTDTVRQLKQIDAVSEKKVDKELPKASTESVKKVKQNGTATEKKVAQKLFASPLPPKSYLARGTQKRCYAGVSKEIDRRKVNIKESLANVLSDDDDDDDSTHSAPSERKRSSSLPRRSESVRVDRTVTNSSKPVEIIPPKPRRRYRRHSIIGASPSDVAERCSDATNIMSRPKSTESLMSTSGHSKHSKQY